MQLVVHLSGAASLNPSSTTYISLVQIDDEIISMVILLLPLIQEGQLLVTGETVYVQKYWFNCLED